MLLSQTTYSIVEETALFGLNASKTHQIRAGVNERLQTVRHAFQHSLRLCDLASEKMCVMNLSARFDA